MQTLIKQLSKTDQKAMTMALAQININNNYRILDSMIRAANKRSLPILLQIKEQL